MLQATVGQPDHTGGAMESPQTAAGTQGPATPMVAVPAENGSTNLAGIRSPGIGPDGRLGSSRCQGWGLGV